MKWSRRRFLGGALALGGGAAAAGFFLGDPAPPPFQGPVVDFHVHLFGMGDCGSDLRLKWALGVPAEVFERGARLLGA